jgi:hypothetical protein
MEVSMRLALRITAVVSILLSALALYLLYGTGGLSDTDPRVALALLGGLVGVLMGLVTFILGVIAAASRRQFGWLIGLIVIVVVAIGSQFVGGFLAQAIEGPLTSNPACQGPLQATPQCQPSATQESLLNVPMALALGAPLLIGVVALIYSFRLREARVPVSAPR